MSHGTSRLVELESSLLLLDGLDLRTLDEAQLRAIVWREISRHKVQRNYIFSNEHQIWHRGRKCNADEPFDNISDLIYPSNGSDRVGRAHIVGEPPVLYASRNMATVMAEIGEVVPAPVQAIGLRVRPGSICKCDVIGDFRQVSNSGLSLCGHQGTVDAICKIYEEDPEEYLCSLLFDCFLAGRFERRVNDDNKHEFRLTSLLAAILMRRFSRALMYPSVQFGGGMNIAIPKVVFDAVFEVVWSTVVIAYPLSFGQWHAKVVRVSDSIDVSGRIHWSADASLPPKGFIFQSLAGGFKKIEQAE